MQHLPCESRRCFNHWQKRQSKSMGKVLNIYVKTKALHHCGNYCTQLQIKQDWKSVQRCARQNWKFCKVQIMQIVTRMTKPIRPPRLTRSVRLSRLTRPTRLTRLSFDLGHLLDHLVSLIVSSLVNHLVQHQYGKHLNSTLWAKNGKFVVQADSTFYPTLD